MRTESERSIPIARRRGSIEAWKQRVEAHHEQSIRTQREAGWTTEDMWQPITASFKADPYRTDDPVLNRLAREVTAGTTLLDVGGGAGRFALPLALRARHVTVVEPSDSMIKALEDVARQIDVQNISVVKGRWEDVDVEPADAVLCAHVVYGVTDIEPFVRKVTSHARERVLILAYMDYPLAQFSPFWKSVHGEERIDLPALPELLNVLWEMDIFPNLDMFDAAPPETVRSEEEAVALLRHFLYVKPGTPKDDLLRQALHEHLAATHEGFTVRQSRPRRQGLLSWNPQPLVGK